MRETWSPSGLFSLAKCFYIFPYFSITYKLRCSGWMVVVQSTGLWHRRLSHLVCFRQQKNLLVKNKASGFCLKLKDHIIHRTLTMWCECLNIMLYWLWADTEQNQCNSCIWQGTFYYCVLVKICFIWTNRQGWEWIVTLNHVNLLKVWTVPACWYSPYRTVNLRHLKTITQVTRFTIERIQAVS